MGMAYSGTVVKGAPCVRSETDSFFREFEGEIRVQVSDTFYLRLRLDEAEALAAEIYAVCAREREAAASAAAGKAVAQ